MGMFFVLIDITVRPLKAKAPDSETEYTCSNSDTYLAKKGSSVSSDQNSYQKCLKEGLVSSQKKLIFLRFKPGTFVFEVLYHIHCINTLGRKS